MEHTITLDSTAYVISRQFSSQRTAQELLQALLKKKLDGVTSIDRGERNGV